MSKVKISVTLWAALFLISCRPPASELSAKLYFDLPAYFSTQVAKLYADSMVVIKTSVINDKTEQHRMQWTDWGKEFTLFTSSDINKPSMNGKYLVDTAQTDSAERLISFTAMDPSLRTRLVEVTYRNDAVGQIHVVNHESTFLSTTHEELYYLPMNSYVIKSEVKNRFFGTNRFSVLGEITTRQKQYF
jgi:hypothetical protein